MAEQKCFVITCNDSVELVVISEHEDAEQQANAMMDGLRNKYYRKAFHGSISREDYDRRCHWAARDTPFVIGLGMNDG